MVAYLSQTPNTYHVIHGYIRNHLAVMRSTKYRLSSTVFPQDTYPDFPSRGGFLMPRASVPVLATASERIPAYFGFLVLAAGLWYRHDDRFRVYGVQDEQCLYAEAFVVHGVSPGRVEEVWRGLYKERQCNMTAPLPS
ncbi:acetylgalactosaminyl-O-glycosyl-glycoprotein beta-1,3-N-acetylglucosaminyltransferase-like [Malaclemys terrapin pileata]|uniref:acetylgalactosaminyl-O-glycosyl-glycoprotein beta-1,3-N-acetylglucosaminyltransferase-like n=1 Tax=Malaclemys terrapin pileata TaxID=2991368 RepID=UPI0023A82B3B|nr:acetylgalactosaminyl-O-glycosyl-glycoprotein beta-1,3-N-acetylglucosaminyltransferase-like [Malaclemys terrapin pileata]